jgi:hypothetical protein
MGKITSLRFFKKKDWRQEDLKEDELLTLTTPAAKNAKQPAKKKTKRTT